MDGDWDAPSEKAMMLVHNEKVDEIRSPKSRQTWVAARPRASCAVPWNAMQEAPESGRLERLEQKRVSALAQAERAAASSRAASQQQQHATRGSRGASRGELKVERVIAAVKEQLSDLQLCEMCWDQWRHWLVNARVLRIQQENAAVQERLRGKLAEPTCAILIFRTIFHEWHAWATAAMERRQARRASALSVLSVTTIKRSPELEPSSLLLSSSTLGSRYIPTEADLHYRTVADDIRRERALHHGQPAYATSTLSSRQHESAEHEICPAEFPDLLRPQTSPHEKRHHEVCVFSEDSLDTHDRRLSYGDGAAGTLQLAPQPPPRTPASSEGRRACSRDKPSFSCGPRQLQLSPRSFARSPRSKSARSGFFASSPRARHDPRSPAPKVPELLLPGCFSPQLDRADPTGARQLRHDERGARLIVHDNAHKRVSQKYHRKKHQFPEHREQVLRVGDDDDHLSVLQTSAPKPLQIPWSLR